MDTRRRLAQLQWRSTGREGVKWNMPKLARNLPQLTHTDGHKFRIGADGHEVLGDPLAAARAHLRLGQIDDTQVTHVAQLVHA